jgi:uncharacterized protein YecT (DUF1311 family)
MKFIITALMTVFTVSAFAVDCSDAISNYDMKVCESKNLDEQDKRLNDLYKKLMAKNDKEGQAKLKSAQRAWMAYRDAECEYAADSMRGGTGEGLVALGCLSGKTKDRADELQDYVEFQ